MPGGARQARWLGVAGAAVSQLVERVPSGARQARWLGVARAVVSQPVGRDTSGTVVWCGLGGGECVYSIISISLSFVSQILLRPNFLQCFCSSVFVKLLRKSLVGFYVYMVSSSGISLILGFLGERWGVSVGTYCIESEWWR